MSENHEECGFCEKGVRTFHKPGIGKYETKCLYCDGTGIQLTTEERNND